MPSVLTTCMRLCESFGCVFLDDDQNENTGGRVQKNKPKHLKRNQSCGIYVRHFRKHHSGCSQNNKASDSTRTFTLFYFN